MYPKTEISEVLVLEPDRLRGAVVARTISKVFPGAVVHCESDSAAAAEVLTRREVELFVVAVRGFDLDVITLLGVWAEHSAAKTRVLVMTPDMNSTALMALRSLPIGGYYNCSSGDIRELEYACRAVASGASYWTPSQSESQSARRAASADDARSAPNLLELLWRVGPPRPTKAYYRRHRKPE